MTTDTKRARDLLAAQCSDGHIGMEFVRTNDALRAIEAALSERGDVGAWRIDYRDGTKIALFDKPAPSMFEACGATVTPLFNAPPAAVDGAEARARSGGSPRRPIPSTMTTLDSDMTPTQPAEGLPEPEITQADRELSDACIKWHLRHIEPHLKDADAAVDTLVRGVRKAIAAARRQGPGGTKAVERWTFAGSEIDMAEHPCGEFVLESDYAALLRERDDLQRWQDVAVQEMRGKDDRLTALANERDALREGLRDSHDEVMRLRDAMFRVYATAANGKDPTDAIEKMRDEMDKPWSGERARALLTAAAEGGDGE